MLRRLIVTLLCSMAILGALSVSPVFAVRINSSLGTAVDFFLRVLLIPFLVAFGLAISCDNQGSLGWVSFAVGPIVSFLLSGAFHQMSLSLLWQQVAFCLISVGCSIAGAKVAPRSANWADCA